MAGRNQFKNPVTKILDQVRKEVMPWAPDPTSAANAPGQGYAGLPSALTTITSEGVDGDGNVITLYAAMTELDSTESDVALTGAS